MSGNPPSLVKGPEPRVYNPRPFGSEFTTNLHGEKGGKPQGLRVKRLD